METCRQMNSSGDGTLWEPKDIGSSIEGVFEARESGEYGPLLLFREPDGVLWKVPMTSYVERVAGQLQNGVTYKLTFVGTIPMRDIVVDERVAEDDAVEGSAAEAPSNRTDRDAVESLTRALFRSQIALLARYADRITPVVRDRLEAILASPEMTDEHRRTSAPFRW
jgi:hypothetical protein